MIPSSRTPRRPAPPAHRSTAGPGPERGPATSRPLTAWIHAEQSSLLEQAARRLNARHRRPQHSKLWSGKHVQRVIDGIRPA